VQFEGPNTEIKLQEIFWITMHGWNLSDESSSSGPYYTLSGPISVYATGLTVFYISLKALNSRIIEESTA
jgi:hypothetical protein